MIWRSSSWSRLRIRSREGETAMRRPEPGGGYQRVRELTSTICANVDKALHMLTSNSLDGSPAAGQPESTPSSGGHGSSRGAVLDSDQAGGGTGNAPGQGKDR